MIVLVIYRTRLSGSLCTHRSALDIDRPKSFDIRYRRKRSKPQPVYSCLSIALTLVLERLGIWNQNGLIYDSYMVEF